MLHTHTRSRRVDLVPTTADDSATFYRTLVASGIESPPAPSAIAADFAQVNALFLVHRRDSGDIIGYSTLHNLGACHIEAGLYTDTSRSRHGIGGEAVVLTINYGFAAFRVDKMIVRTTEASFDGIGAAFDADGREGRLPGHAFFRGRPWDVHAFAMHRAEWEEYISHVAPAIACS